MSATATAPRGFRAAGSDEVRAWAVENGLAVESKRGAGRLSTAAIEGFNAAHGKGKGRAVYVPGHVARQPITGQNRRGQSKTVQATLAEVRAWGAENGYEVGTRGRLNATLRDAFVQAH